MNNVLGWVLLYLLVPVALGILGNIATPWVKSYFEKGSLTVLERRLFLMSKRFRYIKSLKENPDKAYLTAFRHILWALSALVSLVGSVGIFILFGVEKLLHNMEAPNELSYLLINAGILAVTVFFLYMLFGYIETLDNVLDFDKYRYKVLAKMDKLMGMPEGFNKEIEDEYE